MVEDVMAVVGRECARSVGTLLYRLQFVVAMGLLVVIVALLPVLVAAAASPSAASSGHPSNDMTSSPDAVTRSFGYVLTATSQVSSAATAAIGRSAHASSSAVLGAGLAAAHAGRSAMSVTGGLAMTSARDVGSSLLFAVTLPVHVLNQTGRLLSTTHMLRPGDMTTVPTISPTSAVLAAATSRPVHQAAPAAAPSKVIWPLHGRITTLFGVPEPPYEPIHTGLDISDGEPAGISPIHPFMSGIVVQVIHEHIKLGNEVVVSHGHGLTSVYGHLSSISVRTGQAVNTTTILGYEGTTGVSTGPHLHFEIRVNGVPKNPFDFIPGRP